MSVPTRLPTAASSPYGIVEGEGGGVEEGEGEGNFSLISLSYILSPKGFVYCGHAHVT
jgi:hypothetical protein